MAAGASVRFNQGALDRLLASEAGPVGRLVLRKTLAVEREAKHLCPVDTGRLRSSIQSHLERHGDSVVGIVGTNVEYAPHVEFGTIHQRAQPFLRPALSAARGPDGLSPS